MGRPLAGVDACAARARSRARSGTADGALTTEPGVTGEICVRAPHVKDRYDALWATERASSATPAGTAPATSGTSTTTAGSGSRAGSPRHHHGRRRRSRPSASSSASRPLDGVRAAAAVGVGPPGAQVLVVVVVAVDGRPGPRHVRRRSAPAPAWPSTPGRGRPGAPRGSTSRRCCAPTGCRVDIRHASKIDRTEVAAPGGAVPWPATAGRDAGMKVLVTGASGMLGSRDRPGAARARGRGHRAAAPTAGPRLPRGAR